MNLHLFMKLDEFTTTLEQDRVEVGFWYTIPRAFIRLRHKSDFESARLDGSVLVADKIKRKESVIGREYR